MPVLEGYRRQVIETFMDEEAPATLLFAILLDMFDTMEFVDWDPQTVGMQFTDDLNHAWERVPDENKDKVMMMCALYSSNQFFRDVSTFLATCNAFSGTAVDPELFDPATVDEMSWAVTEARLNGFEDEFSDDIKAYVGIQAGTEGFDRLPKVLSWGDSPMKEEAPEIIDGDMYAAQFSQDTADIAIVESECEQKKMALLTRLKEFPFRNKDTLTALQQL